MPFINSGNEGTNALADADVKGNMCASLQRGAQSRARLAVEALELVGPGRYGRYLVQCNLNPRVLELRIKWRPMTWRAISISAGPYERAALPDDARVTLRHKGVDVPGQGTVTGTTPDGLRCHVRWDRGVDAAFSYQPLSGGPKRRVKRLATVGRGSLVAVDTAGLVSNPSTTVPATVSHLFHDRSTTVPYC